MAVPLVALVTALQGCGGEAGAADTVLRRDSAGIEIVESPAPAWTAETAWRLAETSRVDIGSIDGAPEYQLFRITGALALPDGRIAVANSGSHEIRFYDDSGRFLTSGGGEGEGPGEFVFLNGLSLDATGTLLAADARARRVSRFSTEGEFFDSFGLDQPEEDLPAQYVGTLADGTHIGVASRAPEPASLQSGLLESEGAYWRFDAGGAVLGRFAAYSRGPRLVQVTSASGAMQAVEIRTVPFQTGVAVAVGSQGLRAALPDAYEVREHTETGDLARITRYAADPRPITPDVVAAYTDDPRLSPEQQGARRELVESLTLPEFLPTAMTLMVDAAGRSWIRWYGSADDPSAWTVLDETGAWLGTIEMPARFTPRSIGADHVLGVWLDDFDVEHLRLFDLVKP